MKHNSLAGIGLAAVILLAPGGFILGAVLAADRYRRWLADRRAGTGTGTAPHAF